MPHRLLRFLMLLMVLGEALPLAADPVVMGSTSPALRALGQALVPVYQEAGLTIDYRELPAGRLASAAQAGELGAVTVVSEGFLTDLQSHYVGLGFDGGPLAESRLCVYTLRGREGSLVADPTTWAGRKVGVLRAVGPTSTDAFLRGVTTVEVVEAPSYPALVKMLVGQRYDFFVAPQGGVEPDLAALGLADQVVRLPQPLSTVRYYHAVNRTLGVRIPDLEAALARHRPEVERAVAAILGK